VLPISYGDAEKFLGAMGGNVVPANWRGGMPITYHVGGTDAAKAHLVVKSEWSLKTIYNVVAKMEGRLIRTSGCCAAITMTAGYSARPIRSAGTSR